MPGAGQQQCQEDCLHALDGQGILHHVLCCVHEQAVGAALAEVEVVGRCVVVPQTADVRLHARAEALQQGLCLHVA